jgi:hypothetical protein
MLPTSTQMEHHLQKMRHQRMPRKSNRGATCLEIFGRRRKTFLLQTHSTSSKGETYFELLEHSWGRDTLGSQHVGVATQYVTREKK